jgi:uncharacterized protein YdaU (DUF1376 family)
MNEIFFQLRVDEIHQERLQEAADRRLARQARDAAANTTNGGHGLVARLRRSFAAPSQRAGANA